MVITNSGSTQEEWKFQNMCRLHKQNVAAKKDPYPLPFTNEVLNTIVGHDVYSFLDGYLNITRYL
jgi:hypothetical protein